MEIGEDMSGASGYYNDLMNRVDTTIHQSRSAYGGEHAQQTPTTTSQSACLGNDKDMRCQVRGLYVVTARRPTFCGVPKAASIERRDRAS